jgi:hypothetical protein
MQRTTLVLAPAVLALVAGCASSVRHPSALAPDELQAVDRIARARAAHVAACDQRAHPDVEQLRDATAAELRPQRCVSAIHEDALDSCIAQIERTSCANELPDVTSVGVCRVGSICEFVSEGSI